MKRAIGVVVTPEAVTALFFEKTYTGKVTLRLNQVPLSRGCINELSGSIVEASSLQRSLEQLLPRVAMWSFVDTLIYLVLPQGLFDHSCIEIPEKLGELKEDELLESGNLRLAGGSDSNIHGIYLAAQANHKSKRGVLVTARVNCIQDYLRIFRSKDRSIARVISPEIANYQFWTLIRQEVISKRVILCAARQELSRFEVWDHGVLVYQEEFPRELTGIDLNLDSAPSPGAKSPHTHRLLAKVGDTVRQYRKRGEAIDEILLGGGLSDCAAVASPLSGESGAQVVSLRSLKPILQGHLQRFIDQSESSEFEEAVGAMPRATWNIKESGAQIWTR